MLQCSFNVGIVEHRRCRNWSRFLSDWKHLGCYPDAGCQLSALSVAQGIQLCSELAAHSELAKCQGGAEFKGGGRERKRRG